jgi:hypothetical protein
MLTIGPRLDGLLAQELKPLGNEFFSLVGFDGIALGVFNDLQDSFELGLKMRVALQAVKEDLGAEGWRFCILCRHLRLLQ